MKSTLDLLWKPWWIAARESLAAMEAILLGPRGGMLPLILLAAGALVSWFVYVPVHELLHAFGCLATGGTVTELEIQALYGGALLEKIFPFVVAGGPYAGRLTGFDTGGSDLVYLATDAAPYLLTVVGGFWLLRLSAKRRSPLLFGPAVVLLLTPLISIAGDYYEMGSILVSGTLRLLGGSPESLQLLRHDDLFALIGEFDERFPAGRAFWAAAVVSSTLVGYVLACLTLVGSRALAGRLLGPRPRSLWLLAILSRLSSLLAHLYYRITVTGKPVLRRGPVILVANHNNALLDPVMVSVAARRPVRFLAKAPLFTESAVRVLIRASGSIPVYRKMDDASQTGRNVEMFQAVLQALADDWALGLFPEGLSHSGPSLEPLRTGAARIALAAFAQRSETFPVIPVGLVVRHKGRYRSQALIILGSQVQWEDLASRGAEDREAVRELTNRIEAGLRKVTLNLERWEDRPIVECAEAIWIAEHGGDADPAASVARMERATSVLGDLRSQGDGTFADLVRQVDLHRRKLKRLGLRPSHLGIDTRMTTGMRWAVRRMHLLGIPAALLAVAGYLLFRIPYGITGMLARLGRPKRDQVSTFQLIVGVPVYLFWVVGLCIAVGWQWGSWAGAGAALWIPAVGLTGLWIRERWQTALRDIRSFFLIRSRRQQVAALKQRQVELAEQLKELYETYRGSRGDQSLNL